MSLRPFGSAFALGFCLLLLSGCGSGDDETTPPDLGDWTLAEMPLEIVEDLRIAGTDAYYFGIPKDLAVTPDGRIIVADQEFNHLKVLRPDGSLIDTLGGRGQGPGEFTDLESVTLARGDSVYVYDEQQRRATVFPLPPTAPEPRTIQPQPDWENESWGYISQVAPLETGFVGKFLPYAARESGYRVPPPASWRIMSETGVLGDTLVEERRSPISISFEGQGVSLAGLPYGRETQVVVGPDARIYHGYTDRLRLYATAPDGTTERIVDVPVPPIPVTEAERDTALRRIDASDMRRQFRTHMPETKPAFLAVMLDDQGTLWIQRPTDGPSTETRMWRLDRDTQVIHEVYFPGGFYPRVIRGDAVYGLGTSENGAPVLIRYRLQEPAS